MKRYLGFSLLTLVCMIVLTSCTFGGRGMFYHDGPIRADKRMEQVISAISDKDMEALKSLFSKKALEEASSIDKEIDDLLNFIQGDIDSWERDGFSSDNRNRHDKKTEMLRSHYKIVTGEEEYYFFIVDYNKDTINSYNEGVYTIQATTWANRNNLGPWQDRLRAGVSLPK